MGKINIAFDHIRNKEQIKELSVVTYTDSFFYGLWDNEENLLKSDMHPLSEFHTLINQFTELYDLKFARVMSTAKPYVHLAEEDFEKKYFEDYFDGIYRLGKLKSKSKEIDRFVREEICTLHYIEDQVIEQLKSANFPVKNGHISTALANYSYLIDKDVVSYISNDTLHISCTQNNQFKFYNQFDCHFKEDYLYFYMLVLNAFKIDPLMNDIHVGGTIDINSKLYQLLSGYIPKINMSDKDLKIENGLDKHLYFDLYLCKSCV